MKQKLLDNLFIAINNIGLTLKFFGHSIDSQLSQYIVDCSMYPILLTSQIALLERSVLSVNSRIGIHKFLPKGKQRYCFIIGVNNILSFSVASVSLAGNHETSTEGLKLIFCVKTQDFHSALTLAPK